MAEGREASLLKHAAIQLTAGGSAGRAAARHQEPSGCSGPRPGGPGCDHVCCHAAPVPGCVEVLLMHPLDLIKTRFQLQGNAVPGDPGHYTGVMRDNYISECQNHYYIIPS